MKRKAFGKPRWAVLVLLLLAAAAGPLFAQNKVYNLRAGAFDRIMPDGVVVTLWGYAVQSYDLGNGVLVPGNNVLSVPGPRLTVAPGQGLTVNLVNELPAPVSMLIPGQALPLASAAAISPQVARNPDGRIRSFVHETPAGSPLAPSGPVAYVWNSITPGTYLYHSGSHPAVQVQMGLYGALTQNAVEANTAAIPAVKAEAYPSLTNGVADGLLRYAYDQELLFLYSEIDPALHLAVAGGPGGVPAPTYGTSAYPSTLDYNPKYFLVNGEVLDDSAADVIAAGSATLVRFLNASLWDHAPQFLGTYVKVIAEDGKLYPYARQHYSLLLAAGKTLDAVLSPAAAGDISIFDRRLFRSQLPAVQGSMTALVQAVP